MGLLYSILCLALPCGFYEAYLYRREERPQKQGKRHLFWVGTFLLYLYLMFSVVGMVSVWDIDFYWQVYEQLIRWYEVSLIPFQEADPLGLVLNGIMFMPLGFLLPLIWPQMRNLKGVLLTGFCCSLVIELTQLFCPRITDIDDLLMNTLGAVVGYGIWKACPFLFRKTSQEAISLARFEPQILLVLAFLGNFLFYNWHWARFL